MMHNAIVRDILAHVTGMLQYVGLDTSIYDMWQKKRLHRNADSVAMHCSHHMYTVMQLQQMHPESESMPRA